MRKPGTNDAARTQHARQPGCCCWLVFSLAALFAFHQPTLPLSAAQQRERSVGMAGRIEQLVLPGSELEAKPLTDDKTPIVLRIEAAFPHGSAFRYDLVYYGLEAGKYDLRDFLQRKDRSSSDDLPPIPIEIKSVLPDGQVVPNSPRPDSVPLRSAYRWALLAGGGLWLGGLWLILRWGRAKRRRGRGSAAGSRSLADRLQPIVESAMQGKLSRSEQAELERLLVSFWRKRLGLETVKADEAMQKLRAHPEAAALLDQLESWLHQPAGSAREQVDLARLLDPYRQLPADALESLHESAGTEV